MSQDLSLSNVDNPVAKHLLGKKAKLIASWTDTVICQIPAARSHSRILLIDSIPKFVDGLIIAVDCESVETELDHGCGLALHHSDERGEWQDYSIDQIINEYCLLRQIIFDSLKENIEIPDREHRIINQYLDIGLRCAASHFGGLQLNREQGAKETLKKNVENLEVEKEMREQFVSALSHDLRNPLTAARMGAQMLLRTADPDPDSIQKAASRVIENIDRADRMIRDLLDSNRIRAGNLLSLDLTEFNLTELVKSTLDDLSSVNGDRFKLKATEQVKGSWSIDGMRRVLENLCINAVKYGDELKPISVEVQLDKPLEQVHISVHNFGQPIPLEERESLFDQFRRSPTQSQSMRQGWGIGLTLVKGIAESHGGSVALESSQDQGTTFTVKMPLDSRSFKSI